MMEFGFQLIQVCDYFMSLLGSPFLFCLGQFLVSNGIWCFIDPRAIQENGEGEKSSPEPQVCLRKELKIGERKSDERILWEK